MTSTRRATADIARPSALGAFLLRLPVAPTEVATALGGYDGYAAFRRIVREIFPEAEADILAAGRGSAIERETERCWAFVHRVEAEYFPCYEVEEYAQVACGIPLVRSGWSYDRLHDLDMRLGDLLLFSLCEQPYLTGLDTRLPLLDAVGAHVPRELVEQIPHGGICPQELHQRLDGTRFAAAAEFADWLWGTTGTVFLDADDEVEIVDAEWTREIVHALAEQWRRASALLDRIGALAGWLETDPPGHFAQLLQAALGNDPHTDYLRERKQYAYEITTAGLVSIQADAYVPQDAGANPPDAAG